MHLHSSYTNQIPHYEGRKSQLCPSLVGPAGILLTLPDWYWPDPGRIESSIPWFVPTRRMGTVQMYDLHHPDGQVIRNALTYVLYPSLLAIVDAAVYPSDRAMESG